MGIFVVISVNKSLKEMKDDDRKFIKIAAGNCVAFLCFLATVNFWRGIWSLMDFYFFPSIDLWQNLLLSNVVGFLGTFLSGSSLSLTQSLRKILPNPSFTLAATLENLVFVRNRTCVLMLISKLK